MGPLNLGESPRENGVQSPQSTRRGHGGGQQATTAQADPKRAPSQQGPAPQVVLRGQQTQRALEASQPSDALSSATGRQNRRRPVGPLDQSAPRATGSGESPRTVRREGGDGRRMGVAQASPRPAPTQQRPARQVAPRGPQPQQALEVPRSVRSTVRPSGGAAEAKGDAGPTRARFESPRGAEPSAPRALARRTSEPPVYPINTNEKPNDEKK